MELRVPIFKRDLAQHTVGKERAALFRHYRVVTRKRGSEVVLGRIKRGHSVAESHADNGG